ncbi:MAG: glycine cleavage system protein GcvH [Thermodesulfobacteriota bacterium]
MVILEELRYSKDHIWARLDEDNRITVGISDYAQEDLGDISGINLPEEGDEVVKDESFGSVESHDEVLDLFSPVSGEIVEANQELIDSPEILNEDPYQDGWIVRIDVPSTTEYYELLTAEEYEEYLKEIIGEEPAEEEEGEEEEEEE